MKQQLRQVVVFSLSRGRSLSHATRQSAEGESLFPVPEPAWPHVFTQTVPGPRGLEMTRRLEWVHSTANLNLFVDYERSVGNFIVDVDGNTFLDLYCNIATIPLGYNHPAFQAILKDPKNSSAFINRPSLAVLPDTRFMDDLAHSLLEVAPAHLPNVFTFGCGSCANENAFKLACMRFMRDHRGSSRLPTEAELVSAMENRPPGSPLISILSFEKGFHGRLFASLSASKSKAVHKLDIPAYDWPYTPFPELKYPLEAHVRENEQEEARCLERMEQTMRLWKEKDRPVAAVIIEPVLAEGGDKHASPAFFRQAREITAQFGAAFIVDEVQTGGGATGTMWAHEAWGLAHPPDMVTFGKKMLQGGVFYTNQYKVNEPYRVMNTWHGDPSKLLFLRAVVDEIKEKNLLENAQSVGGYLLDCLKALSAKYPHVILNPRGIGTFCAVDCPTTETRNEVVSLLKRAGVLLGGCGEVGIRFRPTLTLERRHVDIFHDIADQTVAKIKLH